MKKFCQGLDQKLKHLMVKKNCIEKIAKIGIKTDDHLPLNKPLKYTTLTIIIKCVLQNDEKLYQKVYLD